MRMFLSKSLRSKVVSFAVLFACAGGTACSAAIDDNQNSTDKTVDPIVAAPVDLGTLVGPAGISQAFAINDHDVIVGLSYDTAGTLRAVTWINHRISALPVPAGTVRSVAQDINNNGVAVGWRADASGRTFAVKWTGTSSVADVASSFNGNSVALAINDRGEIVGYAAPSGGLRRAVRFVNGTVADVLPSDLTGVSNATTISNRSSGTNLVFGQYGSKSAYAAASASNFVALPGPTGTSYSGVAGTAWDGATAAGSYRIGTGPRHCALWKANGSSWTMSDPGTLGGPSSFASSVNATGTVVVGTSDRASGVAHGFRWSSGAGLVDLGALSSDSSCYSRAVDINSLGTIVGYSCVSGGMGQHAVAWN